MCGLLSPILASLDSFSNGQTLLARTFLISLSGVLSLAELSHLRFVFALIKTSTTFDFSESLLAQTQLLHLGQSHVDGEAEAKAANALIAAALRQLSLISTPGITQIRHLVLVKF